jgi:hypothetical protein
MSIQLFFGVISAGYVGQDNPKRTTFLLSQIRVLFNKLQEGIYFRMLDQAACVDAAGKFVDMRDQNTAWHRF